MNRQDTRSRAWTLALVAILALALAPMWNELTHGPGAWAEVATAEALDHGHAHAGDPTGHDASDHEHQHAAILPQAFGTQVAPPLVRDPLEVILARARVPEGPERPPRSA